MDTSQELRLHALKLALVVDMRGSSKCWTLYKPYTAQPRCSTAWRGACLVHSHRTPAQNGDMQLSPNLQAPINDQVLAMGGPIAVLPVCKC